MCQTGNTTRSKSSERGKGDIPPPPGVVLAGGQSRRMGSDKAWIELDGRPLIDHIYERLQSQVSDLALVGGDQRLGDRLGIAHLPDPENMSGKGPLSGVLAGMRWAIKQGHSHVVIVAVDMPFLPRGLVRDLAENIGDADAAFPKAEDRVQWLSGLWQTRLAPQVESILKESAGPSIRGSLSTNRIVIFDSKSTRYDNFLNLNDKADLAAAGVKN